MRKNLLLAIIILTSLTGFAQDFSNKGKDFWVGYGYHQQMTNGGGGGSQDMVLYFATEQVTNITITIPSTGYTQNITTGAGNSVVTSATIPKTGANDARLLTEGLSDKGIHITSDKPMVAYAHVYNQSVSGATILFPTNTLGREYYSVNYKNWSNSVASNCWFYVIATDTGTTTLKITPTGNTVGGWVAGNTYVVNLTQGQIYNVMGSLISSPNNCNPVCTGYDLTGSKVQSVNNGSGCKKISLFSGSGRISITCNNNSSSSDNYMVQAMPKNAWGKKYLTLPAFGNQANNIYRVCVSDPASKVKINGSVTALPLQNNFYYEIPSTNQPQLIESDSAIMVAQYFTSQNACGNGNPGDPEVIYLSAVEQNINKVLWNATPNFAITTHNFNVVIPNTGTAISSFKLDGVTVPAASFTVHPQDPNFSYLRYHLTLPAPIGAGFHVIQSDSGFNAVAYGFGNAESYGYNAGTNIKDLYQQIGVQTQYGIETTPSVCTNSPFRFKVSLPYIPDSMHWDFHGAPGMLPNNNTVYVDNTGNIAEDSVTTVNGRNIHWYSIPIQYTFSTVGVYPITITTFVPNGECGSVQDIDFDLTVSDPPIASFTWTPGGCVAEPYQFTETTPQIPKSTYYFYWNFDDPGSGASNTSGLRNPIHTFSTAGIHNVKYFSITTPGCFSDTIINQVNVPLIPSATVNGNTTVCINSVPSVPVTFTGTDGTAEYIFSYNINGGATLTTPPSTGGIYTINAPTNVAGPFTYNLTGVSNATPVGTPCSRNIAGQSITINITPDATVTLRAGDNDNQTVCINNPIVNIRYDIAGSGTGGSVSGLPTGVTGSFAAGVVTITGTPTVPGIFNYTVSTTGPCVTPSKTGTITVTDNATLALTSGPGTDNQTLCINTPTLTNITYAVGGTGTGGSVSGLPAGVTSVFAGGVITISGTPTVAGVFNYTVTTTGPCVKPSATGTITVTADGTLMLTSAAGTDNQARCINVPITNITYAVGGTATGGSVSGLPPGVTGVYAGGVITISGTPTSTAGSPYNYTVTTTGPCVIPTATGTITVNPDASIVLTSAVPTTSQELCRNSTIINITYAVSGGGTGAGVTGLPAGVTGVYAGGVFTISGTPTVAGLFNYTVTTSGTCVQNSLSGTILVDQLPTASFTYTAPSCETRVISFTDGSTPNSGALNGWTWDFGDGPPTSNQQNPTHVYAAAGTYNVTLTVTTDKGCTSNPIANIAVTINNRPQAGFIVPDVCINDVATPFTDTSKIAVGTINRPLNEWLYGDPGSGPLNSSTGVNGLHLYTSTGNYLVRQIVTSSLGCRDTITLPIVINSADPLAVFTPVNSCSSDSASITNQSTVGFGSVTRIDIYWDVAGAPGVFQTILNPIPNGIYRHKYPTLQTTVNYSVRIIAYSGVICFNNSAPKNLTVYATPIVQFNAMPASCLLVPPFQITQASEIGGVPGTATYSGGPYITSSGIFDPQIAGVGTHAIKYTWTASNPGGCIDTLTRFINVLDTAHATFNVVTPICEQVPVLFTDLSTVPAGVILDHIVWDFGDLTGLQNRPPSIPFTHTYTAPGTFIVRMHNVSTYGCLSTDTTMSLSVGPNHTISLDVPGNNIQTRCINNLINPITYTLGGGATNATVTGLPAGVGFVVVANKLTISGAPATTLPGPVFNYTVNTTGNTCVPAFATGKITVDPDHTIAFSSGDTMQSVCINTAIDDIFYNLGGGANNVTIANLPPGVTGVVTGNILKISGTPTSTAGSPFNYLITTTGNSCVKASADGQIVVHPYPVPSFTVDKPAYCIPNAIVKFTNTTANLLNNTYKWDFGDGSLTDPSLHPTHWYTSGTGPFTVILTATSIAVPILNGGLPGCVTALSVPMTSIHPQPKADFVFSKPSVCIGDNVTITDNTDGRDGIVNQWHWDLGDGTTELINPVTHTYADTITYIITMYTVNSFGCNSDTINVLPVTNPYKPFTVYPYPHVNAGPDKSVLEGGSVQLDAVIFANDPQYNWTPNLYLNDAHISRPRVISPKTDMTYRLTVTARGGCQLSDDVFVKLLKFPVIPNTFTPNNDGINDKWVISFLNTYPDNRVQIFTRSGKLVFESRGYNTPWDGTLKGKPLPFDTYYYIIEPGNGRDPITGYVTILK